MSNHQNGQHAYYQAHNHPVQSQQGQYAHHPSVSAYADQSPPRRSSFDEGDDSRFADQGQSQLRGGEVYSSYGAADTLGSQHGRQQHATIQTNLPYRSDTHAAPLGGYQHQPGAPVSNVPYNPAHFPQTPTQYTQQSYSSPVTSYGTNSYQPYVPAAYQESNLQHQPSVYNTTNSYDHTPHSIYSTSQSQSYPGRPLDSLYDTQQPAAYGSYQHGSQYQQIYSSPAPDYITTSMRQSTYSPPAPPPPPHDSHPTSRPYSHAQTPPSASHGHPSPSTYPSTDQRTPSYVANRVGAYTTPLSPSQHPPVPTPPGVGASRTSPHRSDTLARHPQARPLPGPPSESESDSDYFGVSDEAQHRQSQPQSRSSYNQYLYEADSGILRGQPGNQLSTHSSQRSNESGLGALFPSPSPNENASPDGRPRHLNGAVPPNVDYAATLTDDSDAEALAGLAAMRAAEAQEAAEEARRSFSASLYSVSGSHGQAAAQYAAAQEVSSDSDYANFDMGLAGGGFDAHLPYGGELQQSNYAAAAAMAQNSYQDRLNPRMDSVRSSGVSSEGRESQASGYDSLTTYDPIHPFPEFRTDTARVDTGGTGGLTEPSAVRRHSFEDGDETTMVDSGRASGSGSPSKESMPDLFYHPGMNPNRPLPPPPSNSDPGSRSSQLLGAGSAYGSYNRYSQYDQIAAPYPGTPETYQQALLSPGGAVPRSASLSSTRSAPRADHPTRSKTDSERAKLMKTQVVGRTLSDLYEASTPQSAVALDLPTIPRKKFNSSKITSDQFKKCAEPWALGSIVSWIKDLAEDETDLKEQAVSEGLVGLFTNKVPTMNIADAETLGEKVVKDMLAEGVLIKEEEWVKFGPGTMAGVLHQLSGTGCYSSRLHLRPTPPKGRCYSHYCMRTLKKADLSLPMEAEKKTEDWVTFYKLKKEDLENQPKKEIERQNILHEIVTSEDLYGTHLDVIRILYRDQLAKHPTPIIPVKKLPNFLKEVFGHVDQVKKVNENFLLAQLKYRQTEQGPWITGFSDIFREWIRRARSVYIEYAADYPRADYLMRREAERNLLFKQFLDQAREDKRSNRLSWDTFLKRPITRLQQYGLLLTTVHKTMVKDSEEKTNLQFALDEVRAATFECNTKLAEMEKKMELIELGNKIRLRKGMDKEVELNLDHLGREILIRGDLQRAGGKGFQWVDTHAILFDHYLVLAKTVVSRDSSGGGGGRKYDVYDVSKVPIPMDLIVLESTNDDPVVKSAVKGIGAVTTSIAPRGPHGVDARAGRTTSQAGPGTLIHTNTNTSMGSGTNASSRSIVTTTVLEGNSKEERIMYPFRIKHLGKTEVYTLYAPSATNRQEWCEAIIEAKTRHAASLFAQNAEPFRLRVLADTAFAYDSLAVTQKKIVIKGTPLDRAIKEAEKAYEGQARPSPSCRAAVNCATVFNQPHGRLMCAVGTDYGVYISEYHNPRGWTRAIPLNRVTQVAVFEEFNLFLLIAEKALIAYHLDVVCPPSGNVPAQNDTSARKAPQKLSGTKDVGFFATAKMKERALVFYKKRDGLTSTFKVLEPVLQRSTTTRSRFLPSAARRGQTEFFREYDEFYIPAECYSINLYSSSMAISTARGVEVLTLDKKQPWSVPNLRSDQPETQAHLSSIASRIKDLRPLGMFRLGEAEFLVAFEECAVYVNKHGDISRGVVMEFVGRSKSACLYGQYLILFNEDFVEIRDAMNGRLKQVVAARDCKMLDDGGGGGGGAHPPARPAGAGLNGLDLQGFGAAPRTVKFCLQHPDHEKSHVIVELVENVHENGTQ